MSKSSDKRCGSCIEGRISFFEASIKCEDCRGTGYCDHVWDDPFVEFIGEQWDNTGSNKIPLAKMTPCKKCGAVRCWLLNSIREVREQAVLLGCKEDFTGLLKAYRRLKSITFKE